MAMEKMGKACKKEPMGKHEGGKVKKMGKEGMKDLRGGKDFKGSTMKPLPKKKSVKG